MNLLEELETAVIELDANDCVTWMNQAAEQCLATRRDRLEGVSLASLGGVSAELQRAVEGTRKDTRGRHVRECRLAGALYDCNVKLLENDHVLLELYSLEWAQQQHQLQQRELQTGLMDVLRRNLSHEVRNPLGGIRGAAQMMAAELGDAELGGLAHLIMREADRIDELIRRFGQPELHRVAVDVHKALEEAMELVNAESEGEANIARDYDPSIPAVRADPSALRQVFLNLARNAHQAGARTITVRTRVEHGTALLDPDHSTLLRVDVQDDGEGVPESLRPLLFLPMVTSRRDGTGLGLAVSQQIVSAHGGLLTYEPLDRGSRFSLRLPVNVPESGVSHA